MLGAKLHFTLVGLLSDDKNASTGIAQRPEAVQDQLAAHSLLRGSNKMRFIRYVRIRGFSVLRRCSTNTLIQAHSRLIHLWCALASWT